MKKQLLFLFSFLLIPGLVIAQDTEQKAKVTFGGYVRYEFIIDTYESVDTRDGEVYLYPLSESLDINGDDLNKNFTLNMLGLQARPKVSASGLKAFGADVSAVLEGDFLGISQNDARMLRLRHGFLNMKWQNTELLMGHYWHPMFVVECFPATVSMGAGVPFHILNRAPQARFTANLNSNISIMGAVLIHGYHKSVGPAESQRNSGLPDTQVQLKYNGSAVFASFTAGYKFLTPRLVTLGGVKTNETVGSFNLSANTKLSLDPITVKFEGIFGQNLSHFIMLGGYGAADPVAGPGSVDDYSYTNINTLSLWSDVSYNFDFMEASIFGGYSSNLGSNGDYYSLGYARGENIKYIFRISPRVMVKSGKVDFGLEYLITGAAYGTLNTAEAKYEIIDTQKPTINNRIIFAARYNF